MKHIHLSFPLYSLCQWEAHWLPKVHDLLHWNSSWFLKLKSVVLESPLTVMMEKKSCHLFFFNIEKEQVCLSGPLSEKISPLNYSHTGWTGPWMCRMLRYSLRVFYWKHESPTLSVPQGKYVCLSSKQEMASCSCAHHIFSNDHSSGHIMCNEHQNYSSTRQYLLSFLSRCQ